MDNILFNRRELIGTMIKSKKNKELKGFKNENE
jgi:hypothetical protein